MSDSDLVARCHRTITSVAREAVSGPTVETWEVKVWFCICYRACISRGRGRDFETVMEAGMGRERMDAMLPGYFNGMPLLKNLIRLLEVLRERNSTDRIKNLEYLLSITRPSEHEFTALAKGVKLHKATLAGIWATRPSLRQMLMALAEDQLFDFRKHDPTRIFGAPPPLIPPGRKTGLLNGFLEALLEQRPEINRMGSLLSALSTHGEIEIEMSSTGTIVAKLVEDGHSEEPRLRLDGCGTYSVLALSSVENAFSKARKIARRE